MNGECRYRGLSQRRGSPQCRVAIRGDIESRRAASSQLAASRLFSTPGALRPLQLQHRAGLSFGPDLRPFPTPRVETLDSPAILKGGLRRPASCSTNDEKNETKPISRNPLAINGLRRPRRPSQRVPTRRDSRPFRFVAHAVLRAVSPFLATSRGYATSLPLDVVAELKL